MKCSIARFAALVALFAGMCVAQLSSAIQGTVRDRSQALAPDASVMVSNMATGVAREAVTSADGFYRLLSLGPGVYRVTARQTGFVDAVRERVSAQLRIDAFNRVNLNNPAGDLNRSHFGRSTSANMPPAFQAGLRVSF